MILFIFLPFKNPFNHCTQLSVFCATCVWKVKMKYCFHEFVLRNYLKKKKGQKYHILFYCNLVHKTFMMHSLSNKLFCFISCFFFFLTKQNIFRGGEKKCFTGIYHLNKYKDIEVLLNPVLHTLAMALKYRCTLSTPANTQTYVHTHAHTSYYVQPSLFFYCPFCTNTQFSSVQKTHAHRG